VSKRGEGLLRALSLYLLAVLPLFEVGCAHGPPPGPQIPKPIARSSDPCAPYLRTPASVRSLSGAVKGAKRPALVVTDQPLTAPDATNLYDAISVLAFDAAGKDPQRQACAVLTAMKGAAPPGVALDVWADGIAGLIVRQALEHIERPSGPVGHVIFIDTPHRGRSSAGWPDWAAPGAIPEYAVTGSEFLTRLNASTTRNNIPYVNLARGPPGLPRSAVMQLPRAALHLVLDSPTPAPLWAVLRAPVIAVRQTGPDGPPPRDLPEGPSYRERHAAQYGPQKSTTTLPDLQSLLFAAAVPPESDKFWIESPTARSGRMADPLSVMTDAVSIGYDPRSRDLIITGYVDYFRDPLRTDFFYAALRAYRTSVPAISIDPRRATDPPNQAPVRYEGGVNGTLLGGVMFEADRAMKTLGLGQDNVSSVPVSSGAPGYRSLMDTSGSGTGVQTVWRFWFEPVRWHARESSPLAALIDTRLRVNTQLMSPGVAPSGAATGFARGLTTEFAKYAQEQPSLDQLDQAAAVAAMARWTYEANLDSTPLTFGGLGTPRLTPTVQVRTEHDAGLYRITQIMEGGAVMGQRLRHVRDENGKGGALLAYAVQARPPNAVAPWTFNDGQDNYVAVALPAVLRDAGIGVGYSNPRDDLLAAAYPSDEFINQHFPFSQPSITTATVNDVNDPPVLTLGGLAFGTEQGRAIFNNTELRITKWTPTEVVVVLPATSASGRLVLKRGSEESNAVDLTVITSYRPPPGISIQNNTSFGLAVTIQPTGEGTRLQVDLAPGESRRVRVLPGAYRILAAPRGNLVIANDATEARDFVRGGEYTLTYQSNTFSLGHLTVNNLTGAPLTLAVGGRSVSVPSGRMVVEVPFGNLSISVTTRCGTAQEFVTISPTQSGELTYECRIVR
jgi:hypothetical protein